MRDTQNLLLATFIAFFLLASCGKPMDSKAESKVVAKTVSHESTAIVGDKVKHTCQLTMGWEPWEPYHYQDQEKKVKGLDIELLEMIGNETGCTIKYVKGDWKVLLQGLRKGEIDFLTGASITNKRKEYASFSDGYRTETFRLFVRAGETVRFPEYNMKALIDSGFRLGITMDYIYNDEVNTLLDDPTNTDKIIAVSTGLINFSKLLEGDIDGFLEDPVVGSSSIRRQGLESQIELHPYLINSGDVHLMFSKASVDKTTINRFNQALAKIKADGRHQRLMAKYMN